VSAEREGVRWKLDKILSLLDGLIQMHQTEQKSYSDYWESLSNSIHQVRNTILAGIGFGIGILISLITIDVFQKSDVNFIIYGLIGSGIIYFGSNAILHFNFKKYQSLNEVYENDLIELYEFKGWLIGSITSEEVKQEHVELLKNLIHVVTQSIGYDLKLKTKELFNESEPDKKEYEDSINIAKENLDYFKKIELKIIKRIERFATLK
jgi:hypothetical protein